MKKWLACKIAWYRQTCYSRIFILYAELEFLALINYFNFFRYEWIFCNCIIGISLMLYNKNSWSFCWRSFKGCDNVKKPSEYRKYFLCTILAKLSYCSHRLLLKVVSWFWQTLQWPNVTCYSTITLLNHRPYINMKRLLHWRFSSVYNIKNTLCVFHSALRHF